MNPSRSSLIIDALRRKGVNKPCPRCGHGAFDVVAETQIDVSEDPRWRPVVPQVVATVLVACSNCGFVSQHALGPLGLVTEEAHAG